MDYTGFDLFSQVPDLESRTLVDLGSGDGKMAIDFFVALGNKNEDLTLGDISRKHGHKVTIVDKYPFSGVILRYTEINKVQANLPLLPFENEMAGIVSTGYLFDVMQFEGPFQKGLRLLMSEIYRITQPKGYFVGDVAVFTKSSKRKFIPKKLTVCAASRFYSSLIKESGFNVLTDGVGIDKARNRFYEGALNYFFIAQKA